MNPMNPMNPMRRTNRTRRPVRQASWLGIGALLVGASGAGMALGIGAAQADTTAGSGLGSFSLFATAPGIEWTYDSPSAPTHPELDAEIPETVAQLQPGPIGYGLGAVAWPGSLIANGGSTAGLVGLSLPQPVAANANEPVRAEARTGSGPPTVTNDSFPGTSMTAAATDTEVSGTAVVSGTTGPAPSSSSGNSQARSDVKLTGPATVVATAASTVKDINFAGVVKISSVTSNATATSNGQQAKAAGSTVVTGMSIAGQPVSIDQSGVHVLTGSAPLNSVAAQIVNTAISQLGMKVAVSQPTQTTSAGNVTYNTGNVVFYWSPPGSNGQTFTATLGGAAINLQAVQGGPSAGTGASVPLPAGISSGTGVTGPAAPSTPGGSSDVASGAAIPSSDNLTSAAPTATAGPSGTPTSGVATFQPAADRSDLPKGVAPGWVIAFLLGSGLIAGGLRRLPTRVLEEKATPCALGDQP